ncbi:hypothetical protein [Arthrobacter sp. RIT-PI-e]|uniref:hypothetical protein n=1 Tax=Arthrobacter sp. RIT-PI-e TaxID=1681197 RepID=UPI0006762674|nr:hypothetical protein [Arthrobacter sp. RIT-PI-e]
MRTLVSALLALLSLVAVAVGLASLWVEQNLVDESGFVALAAPLGDDPAFQGALVDSLVQDVTSDTGLPEQFTAFVEPLVRDAATAVTGSAGYPGAWDRTLRLSHDLTFAQAPDPSEPAPAVLSLDLAPVIDLVTENISSGLGLEVPVPGSTTIEVGSVPRGGTFSAVAEAVQGWPLHLAGAGILAVLALLVARRRGITLALLGLGVVLIGVAGSLLAGILPGIAVAAPGVDGVAEVFVRGLAEQAGTDLAASSIPVVVGGLLATVLGIVVQLVLGRRRRG